MMNTLRLLCCMTLICLASCATQQKFVSKSTSLSQCKMTCVQRYQECASLCVDNCPTCCNASSNSTALKYTKYLHEQRIEGAIIARELNSYRDPLQCRKTTCNCTADFNICNQGCTGIIQKRLRAVPYCT